MAIGRHHCARWNFEFVEVVGVVREEISSQINVSTRRIVEFYKVLIVPSNSQCVVAAGKFVDDHLGPETK